MASSPTLFEQSLRLGWLVQLSGVSEAPSHDIRHWLRTGNYSFLVPPSAGQFRISVADADPVLKAYAFDANRMSCGAFETILNISAVELMKRSLSWLAIKSYYAAFYSAHAFLRLQGVSCTQLDSAETSRLAFTAQAYGYPPGRNITSGFHVLSFNPSTKELIFENTRTSGGASHEILWEQLSKGLARIRDAVSASTFLTSDKDRINAKLDTVKTVLSQAGSHNGNWPSKVRNAITYRHEYGVWYPHPSSNHVERYLSLIRQNLTCDPFLNEIDCADTLEAFVKICMFVVNLTRVITIDMASLQAGGGSFQDAGPMVILRRARLAK